MTEEEMKSSITLLLSAWYTFDKRARELFPLATEEEIYQYCKLNMDNLLKERKDHDAATKRND